MESGSSLSTDVVEILLLFLQGVTKLTLKAFRSKRLIKIEPLLFYVMINCKSQKIQTSLLFLWSYTKIYLFIQLQFFFYIIFLFFILKLLTKLSILLLQFCTNFQGCNIGQLTEVIDNDIIFRNVQPTEFLHTTAIYQIL